MRLGEMPQELDQGLKYQIHEANMNLTDSQHYEWFVASLLPHLRVALLQQKIGIQVEVLEIAMILHETPIHDIAMGIQQIHVELQNLCLELKSLKREKSARPEVHKEVLCLKCKSQGHDKYHCHVFVNYIIGEGPMPLRQEASAGTSTGHNALFIRWLENMLQMIAIFYRSLFRSRNNYSLTSVNWWAMMSITTVAMN